jgi:Tol biopolymer transport system component
MGDKPMQIETFTSLIGIEAHPSFSPDGNRVAFTWNGKDENNYDIYVKLIRTESISRLTTDSKADFRPSWSPDGSRIAFQRQDSREKSSIYIMPSIGGQGRKITDVYNPNYGYLHRYNKIAWHPNGEWLVVSDKNSAEEPLGLFLLSLETGEKTRLTSPDSISAAGGDFCASFSKDGNSIVFSRNASWLKTDLFELELNSDLKPVDKPRRITSPAHYIDGTGFTNDDTEIIYSSDNLWRISRSDPSNPTQVLTGNKIADIAISPQGNRLVYRQGQNEVNIWRMSLTDTSTTDFPAERLISSTGIDGEPVYSRNGQKIAFLSNRSGKYEIWICDSDGSNLFQVTSLENLFTNGPSWSPDGKFIVFDTIFERKQDLYIINVEGGNPKRLTTHPDVDWLSAWSKDGEWIYFASHRTGQNQIWKIKPDGSGLKQLTQNGGLAPWESADGQTIYYAKDRSYPASIWKISVNGEKEQQVVEQFKGWRKFWPVENGIYFVMSRDINFLNFDTGKTKTVVKLPRNENYGITVSPDRRFLLYGLQDRSGVDLFLLENFK